MIDVFGNGYRDYLVVERERRGGASRIESRWRGERGGWVREISNN